MSKWTLHQKKALQEMRPYIPGEDLSNVSMNKEDAAQSGGWIARNPENHADQWYVAKQFYEENYAPVRALDDGMAQDAERYRFLRSEEVATDPRYYAFWHEFGIKLCREGKMDELVDAALAAAPQTGEGET